MKLLLDTHTFIWWDSQSSQLPAEVLALLKQPNNSILLSLVSLWEIQIKAHLGKLEMRANLHSILQEQQSKNDISLLPISLSHILQLDQLPWHHKDPFDRLLIAQSQVEAAIIVTRDQAFHQYDCQTLWQ
jgi:PIN domain nuclease of toxin-antitoxin system